MRNRMIQSDFFSSESMADCSKAARLLFIGLWCVADDSGNLKLSLRSIRQAVFPFDDMEPSDLVGMLRELEAVGCVFAYVAGDEAYMSIPNFGVYQTISRPSKKRNPAPSEGKRVSVASLFECTHGALMEHSWSTPSKELIKELINSAGGGNADAPPTCFTDSGDWRNDPRYSQAFGN